MKRGFWFLPFAGVLVTLVLILSGCNPGRGGGGGVSVGTSLTHVYFSLEPVTTTTTLGAPLLSPSPLPFLFPSRTSQDPLTPLQFKGAIETAILGISEIKLRYTGGSTCDSSELFEVKAQGPFLFSLTDAVIRPEIPALAVTHSAFLCEIRLKGNDAPPDRPEKGPPFLVLRGSLEDGRGLYVVSSKAVDFKIRWTPQALTVTVQEIRLRFPYLEWIASFRASDFSDPNTVVIREDSHEDRLKEILDRLEQSAEGKEGKRCDPPVHALLEKNPKDLCEEEKNDE